MKLGGPATYNLCASSGASDLMSPPGSALGVLGKEHVRQRFADDGCDLSSFELS